MQVEEGLNLLKQVCAGFRGNLQEHQTLQEALKVVEKQCSEKKEKKES